MALRPPLEHRLVGGELMTFFFIALFVAAAEPADTRVDDTKGTIAEAERRQREVLAHIFTLGHEIKESAKRSAELTQRALGLDGDARELGREIHVLETKSAERGRLLNSRLNALYRRGPAASALEALFAARSPAEIERQRRFLKLMIEDDHRQMDAFVLGLREVRSKRARLNGVVKRLVGAQRAARKQSSELERRLGEKARLVAELKNSRDTSVGHLRELRELGLGGDLAFFERRGTMNPPVPLRPTQEFGVYHAPRSRVRLMHRGWFYQTPAGTAVRAVAAGRVEFARALPGLGSTVIVDHGDHYYTVYGAAARINVAEGSAVTEGQVIATSGARSPLFGPGVYFELRHFADAIDPRTWIKDPGFATAGVNK